MTIKAKDVHVGSILYPQNFAGIREVVRIFEDKRAAWLGYSRQDGTCFDQGFCSIQHLAQWADRFATAEEIEQLDLASAGKIRQMLLDIRG